MTVFLLWLVLTILSLIVLLLTTVLLAPFSYALNAELGERLHLAATIKWLGTTVNLTAARPENRLKVKIFGLAPVNKKIEKPAAKPDKKIKPDKQPADFFNIIHTVLATVSGDIIRAGFVFLKRLWRSLHLRKLDITGVYGFADPAVTGMLCGFIETFRHSQPVAVINLTPVFEEQLLAGRITACGRFFTGEIFLVLLRFAFSRPIRALWWQTLKAKFKSRRFQCED